MDDTTKDYLLDSAMVSIFSIKKAMDMVNHKHKDKTKRLTPSKKIEHLTWLINEEYTKMLKEYEKCIKKKFKDEHSSIEE